MFRPFQNPIAQGTEILPSTMQAPPVVRVLGVQEGSPEATVLQQAVTPAVRWFVRAQRQNQEIAGLNHVRIRRDFPHMRMTYDRLYGREIIEVELRPEIIRDVLQPREPSNVVYDTISDGVITLWRNNRVAATSTHTVTLNGQPLSTLTTPNTGTLTNAVAHVHGFGPRGLVLPRYFRNSTYIGLDDPIPTPTPYPPELPALLTSPGRVSMSNYALPLAGDPAWLTVTRETFAHDDYAPLVVGGENVIEITYTSDFTGLTDGHPIIVECEFFATAPQAHILVTQGWTERVPRPTTQIFANIVVTRLSEIINPTREGDPARVSFTLAPAPDDIYSITVDGVEYRYADLTHTVEEP